MAKFVDRKNGKVVYRGVHVIAQFKLDRKGIGRCAVGRELRAVTLHWANEAKRYAVKISPESDREHQHYAESFVVHPVLTGVAPDAIGHPPMLRVGARLVNTAAHASLVEWGRKGKHAHRVLGKTLDRFNKPYTDPV